MSSSVFCYLEILNRTLHNHIFESPDKAAFTWLRTSEAEDTAPDH